MQCFFQVNFWGLTVVTAECISSSRVLIRLTRFSHAGYTANAVYFAGRSCFYSKASNPVF